MTAAVRSRALRLSALAVLVACTAAAAAGSLAAVSEVHGAAVHTATLEYRRAVRAVRAREERGVREEAQADAAIASAQATLEGSSGRTLDGASRVALASAIAEDRRTVTELRHQLHASARLAATRVRATYWGFAAAYRDATARLSEADYSAEAPASFIGSGLSVPVANVDAAVASWQQAQASAFTLDVWTDGFQTQIDACRGGVDVTSDYGVPTIAEHSGCGGTAFPKQPGALVRLTGVDSGLYRVIGVVAYLDGDVDTTADLPRGYDLLFQTCATGYTDMSFTALQRIAS
jgi:hypothetical protein